MPNATQVPPESCCLTEKFSVDGVERPRSKPDQRMIIHPVRRRGPPEKFSPTARANAGSAMLLFAGALAVAMHCHLPSGIFIQVSTQRSWASIALPLPSVPLPCHEPPAIAVFPNVIALEVANVADLPITSLDHS